MPITKKLGSFTPKDRYHFDRWAIMNGIDSEKKINTFYAYLVKIEAFYGIEKLTLSLDHIEYLKLAKYLTLN